MRAVNQPTRVDAMLKTLLLFVLCEVFAEDFGYPELSGQRLDSSKNETRTPLYIPGRCPENQWLYPGDQKNDWICDCQPGFLFLPKQDTCFAAYRQGPCSEGEHLIIKRKKVIPECVKNPCREGSAMFDNECYELDKAGGPCGPIEEGGGIFGVNATTLVVECLKGTDLISLNYVLPKNLCPKASIRRYGRKCKKSS